MSAGHDRALRGSGRRSEPAGPVIGAVSRVTSGIPRAVRALLLVAGAVVALGLPWVIYPPVAMDMACWALFAVALDLLLGYTGLLSFGHAAFWGGSAYVTGLVALHAGVPFPLAVLAGAGAAGLLALPMGYLAVRRTGIYFAMVTLAFAQMIYFIANQWRGVTGGENGLQGVPTALGGLDLSDPFYFYYAGLPFILLGLWFAWRLVHSPFGWVLVAIRDNSARAHALGYPVAWYKITVFVISAVLSGLAGGVFAISHGFASLQGVHWTSSGQVVMMVLLGGMGTLWGPVIGAILVVQLQDYLSTIGFDGIGIVTGSIFILVVLTFRRGIWGTLAHRLTQRQPRDSETPGHNAGAGPQGSTEDAEPVR